MAATLHAPRQFIVIFPFLANSHDHGQFYSSLFFSELIVATTDGRIPQTKSRDDEMKSFDNFFFLRNRRKDRRHLNNASILLSVTVLFPADGIEI